MNKEYFNRFLFLLIHFQSTMTQAERRQAAASQWGKKQRQFNGEAIASSHVDLIKTQDSSGAVKHRWRIIRTEEGNEDFINDLDLCVRKPKVLKC